MVFSYTQISNYLRCPRSYRLRYLDGWQEKDTRAAMVFGRCFEQALETAGLMLGSDRSRGYCLEMICADFLAGANLQDGNPDALGLAIRRLTEMLPLERRQQILQQIEPVP